MANTGKRRTHYERIIAAWAVIALTGGMPHVMKADGAALRAATAEMQADGVVHGVIVDDKGEAIIGASVLEKGTSNGTITDADGKFTLRAKAGTRLVISYIGYRTQEVTASATMRIVLHEDSELLNEVVVVGYGTQKKVNLTGAVATVDIGKTLEARPYSDVSKALQGAVSGLSVVNSSGQLGAAPTMTIRGVGTLSNSAQSAPFILVDGVPMDDLSLLNTQDIQSVSVLKDAASTSIYGARAAFGVILITTKSASKTDRTTVNYTNNIAWETPTILPNYPDVPTQLRALIEANDRAGEENEIFGMYLKQMLPDAEKWRDRNNGRKTGYREMVLGEDFTLDKNGVGSYFADWDMVNIMFRKWRPSQSHNVSVQGTSGKTSYYMSVGYNHDEGVMRFNPEKLNKWTTMLNVTTDLTNWLQVGARFSYSNKGMTGPATRRTTYQYMWRWGSFFGPYGTYKGTDFRNDIAYRKQAGDRIENDAFTRLGGFLKATLAKGLTLNADYTFNVLNRNRRIAEVPLKGWNSWGGKLNDIVYYTTSSNLEERSIVDRSYVFNLYGNYLLDVQNAHHFNFMLGANAESGELDMHSSTRNDLLAAGMPEFNLANGDQFVDGSHSHWATAGYFGRVNYDYKGIWLLELNGRYDGSSRFPANSRWAFFPSISGGWRISEQSFFEPIRRTINNMKLRASYGEIGNQAVGDNMFISTIGKRNDEKGKTSDKEDDVIHWLGQGGDLVVAYGMPKLVSSKLRWERIQTLDVGADFGFLDNSLNISFDWYQRTTRDMLAPGRTVPQVLGANPPYVNAGVLRTRGWELNIDWRHRFNEVTVYANANLGDYTTTIVEWDNDTKLLNSNYSGKRYGDIWGFETDRYFTKEDFNADGTYKSGVASQKGLESGKFTYGPGDIKFKDLNGDGKIDGGKGTADDHGDLKVIGNTTPRYQYGFHLGGEWRNFDVDLFFQGVGKRDVWTQSAFVMPFMRGADALYANQTSYWTEKNPDQNADFPRLFPGNASRGTISVLEQGRNNFYPQTKYLVNMAYLRFKNLTVGYTLPQALTRKAHIQKVRVYFSGSNIMEIIKRSKAPVDPEVNDKEEGAALGNATWGRIDPMYRTFSFGLQLTL